MPRRRMFADDPLYAEMQRHGKTMRRLEDSERRLAEARTRVAELEREKEAQMKPDAIEALVKLGLSQGRIAVAEQDTWRRSFESDPGEATRALAARAANPEVAAANFMLESPVAKRHEEELAAALGFGRDVGQVI